MVSALKMAMDGSSEWMMLRTADAVPASSLVRTRSE